MTSVKSRSNLSDGWIGTVKGSPQQNTSAHAEMQLWPVAVTCFRRANAGPRTWLTEPPDVSC